MFISLVVLLLILFAVFMFTADGIPQEAKTVSFIICIVIGILLFFKLL